LARAEGVGCVAYPVMAWTDILLWSAAVVGAVVIGPVVAATWIAVVPLVLARVIIGCLDCVFDEIVVIDLGSSGGLKDNPRAAGLRRGCVCYVVFKNLNSSRSSYYDRLSR